MVVKVLYTVLDEAYERQVEEAMETLVEGLEDFYKPLTDPKPPVA